MIPTVVQDQVDGKRETFLYCSLKNCITELKLVMGDRMSWVMRAKEYTVRYHVQHSSL